MARAALRHIILGLATTGLLMGCVEGAGGSAGDPSPGAATTPAKRGTGKDVEAPEIFQTTDSALWDGRPSLGGIWVASPDVTDPQRVVMFNPATGKSITGALFRRERENPGPALQLSSDAAEALGILAGQPAEIRVTAVRRDDPEPEPVDIAADPAAEPAAEGAEPVGEAAPPAEGEATAIAAAALDAVDAGAEGATDAAAVAAGGVDEAVTPQEPPKKKTWKERRAEAKAKREAEKAAKAAAAAGEAPAEATTEGAPVAEVPASPDAIVIAPVESGPLDARSAEVTEAAAAATEAPPAPEKKKTRRQIREEEEAAKAAAEAAATDAAATPAPVGRPIQIASFSKEENANRAVEALAKIGVTAQPAKTDNKGKVVWGVVATGDDALLEKIKAAGFADAYFLK